MAKCGSPVHAGVLFAAGRAHLIEAQATTEPVT
jgi:hypothetical protein